MDPEVPTFLAPRRRRLGIRERLDAKGHVLTALDESDVRAAIPVLRAQGVAAIAVCYLFSFVNPAHERRTREIIAELAPEMSVSLSSEVDPTFREYERLCVTAFDAYLGPVVKRYLAGLADTLHGLGVPGVPLIMRSRGGIVSAALAAQQPVTLFLSGPAGGVIGAELRGGAFGGARLRVARHGRHQQRRRGGARRQAAARGRGDDRPVPRAHADGGREHHRRRGRQHRVDRRGRRTPRGPEERRRGAGPGVLRPRRRRSDRHRCERGAGLSQPRTLRRRLGDARRGRGRARGRRDRPAPRRRYRSRPRPGSIAS